MHTNVVSLAPHNEQFTSYEEAARCILQAFMPLQRLRQAIEQNRPLPQLPLCGFWHTSHKPGTPLGCRLDGRFSTPSLRRGASAGRRVGADREDEACVVVGLGGRGALGVGGGRGPAH